MNPFFHDCGDTSAIISFPKIKDAQTGHSCLYVLVEEDEGDVLKEIRCVLRRKGTQFSFVVEKKERVFPSHKCQLFTSPVSNTYLIAYPSGKNYALASDVFPNCLSVPSIEGLNFNGKNFIVSEEGNFLLSTGDEVRLEKDKFVTQHGTFNIEYEGEFIVCLERYISRKKKYIYDLYFLDKDKKILINLHLSKVKEKENLRVERIEHSLFWSSISPPMAHFDGRRIYFTYREEGEFITHGYFSFKEGNFCLDQANSVLLPGERVISDVNNDYYVSRSQIRVIARECIQ